MKRDLVKFACASLATVMLFSCTSVYSGLNLAGVKTIQAASAAEVGITDAQGWLESAWVEWKPVTKENVSYYTVSYSKDGKAYTKIDDELIRMYSDGHWRADIVGIAAGSYTVKVDAYNSSNAAVNSETANITVSAYDRTGYTFSPSSNTYDSSDPLQCGGYKGDGTPKANADILYITSSEDVDNVELDGVKGLSNILQSRDKRSKTPLIVRIVGKIAYVPTKDKDGKEINPQLNGSGYIQVKPSKEYTNYNTTIEGIGSDATINFGILLRDAGNVEIRNLAVHDFKDDGISLDTSNCNIWLHNNEFFYGVQGSGDKAKGDGSSDIKNDSKYVTLSYNHYWDAGKCSLCGMKKETGDNFITYHHNWFDHSDSRHPRIRTMFVHVFNNYYDGNAKYGIGASGNSNAFVEGNYFRNCHYPVLQGSVGNDYDPAGSSKSNSSNTFDDDDASIGAIKLWNNYMEGATFTAGKDGETAADNDGCVAVSRDQKITYTTKAGATYRNIDVSDAYIQSLANVIQSPEDARATVQKYAGRTGGTDFAKATGFAFVASDDTDYEINTKIRSALTNYCSDSLSSSFVIASVGGSVDGSIVPVEPEPSTETTTEGGTKEPVSEETTIGLVALEEGTYAAADIVANENADKFKIDNNKASTAGQLKIDTGSVIFAVKDGAHVVINYKCGSSDSSKSASISCAGQTGKMLAGSKGDNPITDALTLDLKAGEYKITAAQSGGTQAQIISIIVTYGGVPGPDPDPNPDPDPVAADGDADGSGKVTSNDAAIVFKYAMTNNSTAAALEKCDVDGDGKITASDASQVLSKAVDENYVYTSAK